MWYYEWCSTPRSRSGLMVPETDLQKFIDSSLSSGFRSVFGFSKEHADVIKKRGNSKGFKEFPCYADKIVIDTDEGDKGRKQIETILEKQKLSYKLYSSGGKGYHFILPCNGLYSVHTPYSHRMFVEGLGIQADTSIYRHSGLISLEGRIHPKTKRKKEFIHAVMGFKSEVLLVQPPPHRFVNQLPEDYDILADGLERAASLIMVEPTEGERYMSLWYAVKCLSEAGVSPETSKELVKLINDNWSNPKESSELDRVIEDCYG